MESRTSGATTRSEALARLPEYKVWSQAHYLAVINEEIYNPQRLRDWTQETWPKNAFEPEMQMEIDAVAVGEFPPRSPAYPVFSLVTGNQVSWLDPAGYLLAQSTRANSAPPIANHQRGWFSPPASEVSLVPW